MNINITGGRVKVSLTKPERDHFAKLTANASAAANLAESIARQNVENELVTAAKNVVEVLESVCGFISELEIELVKHEKGGE